MNRNRFGTSSVARVRRCRPRCRVRPAGRGADDRQLDRHPAAAGSGLRGGQRHLPASQQQPGPGGAAADRARRPARRGRLPQGEDAQGRQRHPQRLHRRARPAAGSADPCARRRARQRHGGSRDERRCRDRAAATGGGTGGVAGGGDGGDGRHGRDTSDDQARASEQGTRSRHQRDPRRAGDRRPAARAS